MGHEVAERTATRLRERLGDGLRTVVVATADGWEASYLRDDLRKEYDQRGYEAVVDVFRSDEAFLRPATGDLPIGPRHAVVHYHENAFVLQFPISEAETILISVSPESGRDLMTFIESCRTVVDDD